jgi:hypothetical protein
MTFNYDNGDFVSFAVYADVTVRDQRFFEANEGITELEVNDLLAQASQRILTQIRNTDWWSTYQFERDTSLKYDMRLLPSVNPDNILAREQEFKDLNIYFALSEYLYPRVADFGNPDSAEVNKIKFYRDAYNALFKEVIQSGDWYDFSGTGTITTDEKQPVRLNLVRIR